MDPNSQKGVLFPSPYERRMRRNILREGKTSHMDASPEEIGRALADEYAKAVREVVEKAARKAGQKEPKSTVGDSSKKGSDE